MSEPIRKKEGETTVIGHEEVYQNGPPDRDKEETRERVEEAVKNARVMDVDEGTIIPADKVEGESWSQGRGEVQNSSQEPREAAPQEKSTDQGVTPSPQPKSSPEPAEEGPSESLNLRDVPVSRLWSVLLEKTTTDQLLGMVKQDAPEVLQDYLDQFSIEEFIADKVEPFKVRFEIEGFGRIGCRYSLFKPMKPENVEQASSIALLLGFRTSREDEVFIPEEETPFRMVVGCDCNDAQALQKVERVGSVFEFKTLGYSFMLMTADLEAERQSSQGRINSRDSIQEKGFFSSDV